MLSHSILKTFLFATILLAAGATAAATAPTDEAVQSSAGSIHTYLTPDLSLKTVFSATVLQETARIGTKTCRCSCGVPCQTDADCGGNVCGVGITCCFRSPEAKSFQDSAQSSRKTDLPAFKSSCN